MWIGPGNHHELELHFGGKALALRSTHGPEDTVIDARQLGRLLRFEGDGPQVVVAGFTLTGGLEALGGAISMTAASPTLEHLMVWGNRASMSGGAIYLEQGSAPSIRKTSFYSNVSVDQIYNPFVSGGALSGLDSSPTIVQSAFYGNAAIGFAGSQGHFELNVFNPMMAYNFLQSVRLLADAAVSFTDNCVVGIEPREDNIKRGCAIS